MRNYELYIHNDKDIILLGKPSRTRRSRRGGGIIYDKDDFSYKNKVGYALCLWGSDEVVNSYYFGNGWIQKNFSLMESDLILKSTEGKYSFRKNQDGELLVDFGGDNKFIIGNERFDKYRFRHEDIITGVKYSYRIKVFMGDGSMKVNTYTDIWGDPIKKIIFKKRKNDKEFLL